MEYTYHDMLGNSHTLEVEQKTLEQLLRESDDIAHDKNVHATEYRKKLNERNNLISYDTFKDYVESKAKVRKEYEQLQNDIYYHADYSDRCAVALHGVYGATEYALAMRLNDIFEDVLPKYAGKKAGPKTSDKFWKEVAQELGFDLSVYMRSYHTLQVCRSVNGGYHYYEVRYNYDRSLTDDDNRFNETFSVRIPSDQFDGNYPKDWLNWADCVIAVNKMIEDKFDKLCKDIDSVVHSLSIGDTEFNRVHSYDLKKE